MSIPDADTAELVKQSFSDFESLVTRWSLEDSSSNTVQNVTWNKPYDAALQDLYHISNDFSRVIDEAIRNIRNRRNNASTVNRLPVEILCSIFVKVGENARDKLVIAQTCQFWRKIALGFPFMWTSVNLDTITSSYMASKIFRRGQDYPLCVRCRQWNDLRIACVVFELPRLQELDVTWANVMHGAFIGKKAPSLTRLRVMKPRGVPHVQAPSLFLSAYPSLEELSLIGCRMAFTPSNFRGLKKLFIHCYSFNTPRMAEDLDILFVLQGCPDLESLTLVGLDLRSEQFAYHPASHIVLPRLHTMRLTLCGADFRHMLSNVSAPNLRRLQMQSCGRSGEAQEEVIITDSHPSLTVLASTRLLVVDDFTSTICAFNSDAHLSFIFAGDPMLQPLTCHTMLAAFAAYYPMSYLRTLRLRAPRTSDVIMLLRNLQSVETLELVYMLGPPCTHGNTDIIHSLLLEAKRKTEHSFCSKLRTLALERVYFSVQTIFDLLEFIELRSDLRHLRFHWCKGDLPMEELAGIVQSKSTTVRWFRQPLLLYEPVHIKSLASAPL